MTIDHRSLDLTAWRGWGIGELMTRIRVLPPEIANVIAAGEVVERPASVVKELVENALDAGATDIVVRLEGAGKTRLSVEDNGCGMSADDVVLALERHATSKLTTAEDLHTVATLGFRGEALPSIAAVGTLRIVTRTSESSVGTELRVARGETPTVREIGAPLGTTVEVADLFAAIPARRKFLKGDRTELAHIQEILTRLALVAPHCRFRLDHEGRALLTCHAIHGLAPRVTELFGADCIEQMIPLEHAGTISLQGLVGLPALAKPGASQLYTFVNGRPIRDRIVHHAITEGFRTFIPQGYQPFVVLMLTMPPAEVDVNVHPAKAEVRFANAGGIHHLLSTAIRKALERHRTITSGLDSMPRGSTPSAPYAMPSSATSPLAVQEALALYQPMAHAQTPVGAGVEHSADEHSNDDGTALPHVRPLGQLAKTYLMYEAPGGGLLIIDQHAAHERIGYEALKANLQAGALPQQLLVTPFLFEGHRSECAILLEHHDELLRLGFDTEPFGAESLLVKSIPAILAARLDLASLLAQMAHDFQSHARSTAVEERIDRLLTTMACHRQIRAGDVLQGPHLTALLDDLQQGTAKDRCPHGRPTWVVVPKSEIEKWFHRR